MKLFVRGGVGIAAVLFAAFLTFNARPLLAEVNPSQEPAQAGQKKQEPASTTERKQEAGSAQAEKTEHAETVSGAPAEAVKDNDLAAAPSVNVATSTKVSPAPITTAPQNFTAYSYSLCCRGSSGLGTRRGTIAADPRVLPYGTRVRLEMGSYSGEYLVTDSGTAIKGNKIDVWVPTVTEARRFGRKNVKLTVLSYGGHKAKAKK
jgi:3D (Asp-Asp-Asp) domain-containing protein